MTPSELAAALQAELIVDAPEARVTCAYASDLLSDVMAHMQDGAVLITIQNHINTIAVSTLAGAAAILLCHGRDIPDDMAQAARREHIALLRTPRDQYETCCAVSAALRC